MIGIADFDRIVAEILRCCFIDNICLSA